MNAIPMTDHYFAYGMLTHPNFMGSAQFMGPAVLSGYRPEMLGYANIVSEPGHEFQGVLWGIDRRILRELDQIEGYPDMYSRRRVRVNPTPYPGTVDAWVYMMTPDSRLALISQQPGRNYLRLVSDGYRHAGIPFPFW